MCAPTGLDEHPGVAWMCSRFILASEKLLRGTELTEENLTTIKENFSECERFLEEIEKNSWRSENFCLITKALRLTGEADNTIEYRANASVACTAAKKYLHELRSTLLLLIENRPIDQEPLKHVEKLFVEILGICNRKATRKLNQSQPTNDIMFA